MTINEFLESSQEVVTAVKVSVYSFFAYLGISGDVVEVLFVLMCIDTILGLIKAIVLGNRFTFEKLLWGITTKLSVLIIPMVIALVAKGLSFDFHWFVLAVLNILIAAEGFSAIGNILSIKSKKNVENVDFISLLLRAIRKGLTNVIKRSLAVLELGVDPMSTKETVEQQKDTEVHEKETDNEGRPQL